MSTSTSERPGRLLRTIVVVEVLHRDPLEFDTLADLHHITMEDASGSFEVQSSTDLTPAEMRDALVKQHSDPAFLLSEEELEALGEGSEEA